MRRSTARKQSDSLDLLLDTICNSFGGILFICVLVAVLLRMGGPQIDAPTAVESQLELLQLRENLAAAEQRLHALGAAAAQQRRLRAGLAPSEIESLHKELADNQSRRDAWAEQVASDAGTLADLQQSVESGVQALVQLDTAQRSTADELQRLREEHRREKNRRTVQIDAPRLRPSRKQELGIFVRDQHVTLLQTIQQGTPEWNSRDCEFDSVQSPARAGPRAGVGFFLDPDNPDLEALKAYLSPYAQVDRYAYHVTIIIWPDSFSCFQPLKQVVKKELGFEYRTLPMSPEEDIVRFGSAAGASVQ